MKRAIAIALMIVGLYVGIYACGAPQLVYGHIDSWRSPYLTLTASGYPDEPAYITRANQFGFFSFGEVLPCTDYRLDAYGKGEDFVSIEFLADGEGSPIWIDVMRESNNGR